LLFEANRISDRARLRDHGLPSPAVCRGHTAAQPPIGGRRSAMERNASERSRSALRDRGGELDEEIVGGLLRRAVDQALAKLGELAADLRLHVVGEKRAAILVGQRDLGAALGKARNTPLAFAGNAIAVGWIEIGEPDLALPACLDRADLDRGDGLKLVVRSPVELLAARDAALEHLVVVELFPYQFAFCSELHLPIHRHRHRSSPSSYRVMVKLGAADKSKPSAQA